MIGSIKDDILNVEELALEVLRYLEAVYPGTLQERYGIEESSDAVQMLASIAEARKCVQKGNEPDYGKAAAIIMEEFRNGKIGRISLEQPPKGTEDA